MQHKICTEKTLLNNVYHSSYDYAVYDIGFIFTDEDEDEVLEENYFTEVVTTGMGGNFH